MTYIRPWSPSVFSKLLEEVSLLGEVAQIRMNGRDYADLRMFGRDEGNYEFIFGPPASRKAGHVLTIDGNKMVFVSRLVLPGSILFFSGDGREFAHTFSSDGGTTSVLHSGPFSSCLGFGGVCLVRSVMDT